MFIKNFDSLSTTPQRKLVLDLVETGLEAIQFKPAILEQVSLEDNILTIKDNQYDLTQFDRIFLVGFGKGSADVSHLIEETLGDKLTAGWDIDVVEPPVFKKVAYTKGNHPVPTQVNLDFTRTVLDELNNLTERDLVLVAICGGGSALFEYPQHLSLEGIAHVNDTLVKSGATIGEMNIVRKHLSAVKGGKFAQHLFPATIACLLFSDVPGNDLSTIASGPTVLNATTMTDVKKVIAKYQLDEKLDLSDSDFSETPHDAKYFAKVANILVVSNRRALEAMQRQAKSNGADAVIYSEKIEGDARSLGRQLLQATKPGQMLLVGGESTIHITHKGGRGGRNQALTLAALRDLPEGVIICSFDSDGWDFYGYAGAIGDAETLNKAAAKNIDPQDYLTQDNSFAFWEATGDGIDTGKLDSNVADLIIIYRP